MDMGNSPFLVIIDSLAKLQVSNQTLESLMNENLVLQECSKELIKQTLLLHNYNVIWHCDVATFCA